MWRGPQEYITFEFVLTSPAVSRVYGSSNFDSFLGEWKVAVQLLFCGVFRPGPIYKDYYIYIYIYIYIYLIAWFLIYDQKFHAVLFQQLSGRERNIFEKSKKSKNTIRLMFAFRLVRLFNCCVYTRISKISIAFFIHQHHVVRLARISLALSLHVSLSFIVSGRSSGLHPVSSHSCCMNVRALVVLLLIGHIPGSTGVHLLRYRPCTSSSVRHVWFV